MKRLIEATNSNISDKKLKNQITQASRRIERLAKNGAPNTALKASYNEVIDKIKKGNKKQLEKSIEYAVKEKARYRAERIARTEIARAHGISQDNKALENKNVIGIKFLLSNRHAIFDICDIHTSVDFYSMGQGVYPKDQHPYYPFHPHCTCSRVFVYKGEAEKGKYNKEKFKDVFERLGKSEKENLMGVSGFKDYKKTKDWESNLKNWNGQEKITKSDLF